MILFLNLFKLLTNKKCIGTHKTYIFLKTSLERKKNIYLAETWGVLNKIKKKNYIIYQSNLKFAI